ncbi:BspA family leucine-rich repeat surface protein, partial [Hoylesella saccharolytica]|uniref:BspA family leucine-rich repeat surface protein n=1 Tax=Hoylesella saccharolytica TaxID=633701 RepID=UPI0028E393FE
MKNRLTLLMLLPVMAATMMLTLMQCAPAKSKEAYVVKSTDGKTLTFYYDTLKASRTGTVFGIDSMQIDEIDTVPAWAGNMIIPDTMLAKVNFDTSFKDFRPKTTSCWFANCNALKRISGMENLNTSEVTDMSRMFEGCISLTELDVTKFDTRNVTDMRDMFFECSALTKLDVTNFDTRNVTNMRCMFSGCSALTKLDVTNF